MSIDAHQSLLRAVLRQAVLDLRFGTRTEQEQARQWLTSPSEREFGLRWLCGHLQLDADAVVRFAFDSHSVVPTPERNERRNARDVVSRRRGRAPRPTT